MFRLSLLLLAAPALAWAPSPACQAAADAYCARDCAPAIAAACRAQGAATLARKSGPQPTEWRCYSPGALTDNATYARGTCYCSRDAQIRAQLQACGDPDPSPPPAPPAPLPPLPEPPVPQLSSGLPSANVFWRGQQAADGTVYPCVRIPSLLQAGGGVLLAFAECRLETGDGCFPANYTASGRRDVCMRRSTDAGRSWGPLQVLVRDAMQNTPVYDAARGAVVLSLNVASSEGNAQLVSLDSGASWGGVQLLAPFLGPLDGADVGPGVGLQLSATHPLAPGRLLFIGHRGAYVEDVVWYSDDGGATYNVSSTPAGRTLPRMDEAQLVELSNGAVLASMRNEVAQPAGSAAPHLRATAVSTDGGATFSAPAFDPALPEPVCQASIVRAPPPRGDGAVYFSNPGQAQGRVNGRVRRSRACAGAVCPWDDKTLVVAEGLPFAYSCLAPMNTTHMGLLWETGAPGCSAGSNACLQVFTTVPLSAFD